MICIAASSLIRITSVTLTMSTAAIETGTCQRRSVEVKERRHLARGLAVEAVEPGVAFRVPVCVARIPSVQRHPCMPCFSLTIA